MKYRRGLLALAVLQCHIYITDAVMCYTCDHVAHPRDCDRIVECKPNQSCHVVAYAQPDGHFYYATGCLNSTSCPRDVGKRDIAFCNRCCTGDYCNKELCDGPPPGVHGPRCLECTTVEDPTHCGAVVECAKGQVCYTQEKYVFGELRFQLGCTEESCLSPDVFGRRDSLCKECCTGENCNKELCQNTESPYTAAPVTVSSGIPTTAKASTIQGTSTAPQQTTFPYDLDGCLFKGHWYHEGDSWEEKCQYKCTCIDNKTGRYTCQDICPQYVNVPDECHMEKDVGECCEHPVCPGMHIHVTNFTTTNYTSPTLLDNCYYQGQEYGQNETWRDGCDYDCQCVDATRGYYRCTSVCYSWNLPDECHLEPPATGKCCQTPSCPPRFTINYPPDYVEN